MKILFVTYDLPWPLNAGGKIRSYNLIKQLAEEHKIVLYSYYRDEKQLKYVKNLSGMCSKIKTFKRIPVFSLKHVLATLSNPMITSHISHYYNLQLKHELENELKVGDFDILHLESFYTSHLLGEYSVKQVLGTENIEWKIYQQHARQQSFFLQFPLLLEAFRTKQYEQKTWRKADLILAVSQSDRREIESRTDKPVHIIPNGVDTDYFKFSHKKDMSNNITVLFVGDFSYVQNQDAAFFLSRDIYPRLRQKLTNSKLLLVGRNIPKRIKRLRRENILIKENVYDIRKAYAEADVLVAPLRISSGTQFKLLEAMAVGLPVVTTPMCAEALKANKDKLWIGETPEEIAECIFKIYKKAEKRAKIVKNAREFVETNFGWELIGEKIRNIYRAI